MATDDNIIAKIRKLLALAQSPNEHEAALAAAKAQALLTEYALTLDDVEESEFVEAEVFLPGEQWRLILLSVMAQVNSCRILTMVRYQPADPQPVRLVGPEGLVTAILELYETLHVIVATVIDREWQAHVLRSTDPFYGIYPSLLEPSAESEWKHSFAFGLIARLEQRLAAAKAAEAAQTQAPRQDEPPSSQPATTETPGTGLMKLDLLAKQVEEFINKTYAIHGQQRHEVDGVSMSTAARGMRAAESLPLHAQKRVTG